MSDLLYEEESYAIRGAVFEVYREMGCGFVEPVYQECVEKELLVHPEWAYVRALPRHGCGLLQAPPSPKARRMAPSSSCLCGFVAWCSNSS